MGWSNIDYTGKEIVIGDMPLDIIVDAFLKIVQEYQDE